MFFVDQLYKQDVFIATMLKRNDLPKYRIEFHLSLPRWEAEWPSGKGAGIEVPRLRVQVPFSWSCFWVDPGSTLRTCLYSGTPEGGGGGGRGYLRKFNTRRLRPEVQPLTLLYTILAEKVPLLFTFC